MPLRVGAQDAELGVGVVRVPGSAGLFEKGVEHVFVAAFDEPGADGQSFVDGAWAVEVFAPVGEVAFGRSHGGFFLGGGGFFLVLAEDFGHGLVGSAFEPLLLGAQPGPLASGTDGGGRGEGFADVPQALSLPKG